MHHQLFEHNYLRKGSEGLLCPCDVRLCHQEQQVLRCAARDLYLPNQGHDLLAHLGHIFSRKVLQALVNNLGTQSPNQSSSHEVYLVKSRDEELWSCCIGANKRDYLVEQVVAQGIPNSKS